MGSRVGGPIASKNRADQVDAFFDLRGLPRPGATMPPLHYRRAGGANGQSGGAAAEHGYRSNAHCHRNRILQVDRQRAHRDRGLLRRSRNGSGQSESVEMEHFTDPDLRVAEPGRIGGDFEGFLRRTIEPEGKNSSGSQQPT
jgi:hypothetical protein